MEQHIDRMEARIARAPAWLRPGLTGLMLIYLFIVARGGLVLLPIVVLIALFVKPEWLVTTFIPVFLVYLPAACFLGGMGYGLASRLFGRYGRLGWILKLTVAFWIYFGFLTFLIIPTWNPRYRIEGPKWPYWLMVGIMGLSGALVLELGYGKPKRRRPKRTGDGEPAA